MLEKLGFPDIAICPYGQSAHPELNNLEKQGKFSVDAGFPSVVIVEATREFTTETSSSIG